MFTFLSARGALGNKILKCSREIWSWERCAGRFMWLAVVSGQGMVILACSQKACNVVCPQQRQAPSKLFLLSEAVLLLIISTRALSCMPLPHAAVLIFQRVNCQVGTYGRHNPQRTRRRKCLSDAFWKEMVVFQASNLRETGNNIVCLSDAFKNATDTFSALFLSSFLFYHEPLCQHTGHLSRLAVLPFSYDSLLSFMELRVLACQPSEQLVRWPIFATVLQEWLISEFDWSSITFSGGIVYRQSVHLTAGRKRRWRGGSVGLGEKWWVFWPAEILILNGEANYLQRDMFSDRCVVLDPRVPLEYTSCICSFFFPFFKKSVLNVSRDWVMQSREDCTLLKFPSF